MEYAIFRKWDDQFKPKQVALNHTQEMPNFLIHYSLLKISVKFQFTYTYFILNSHAKSWNFYLSFRLIITGEELVPNCLLTECSNDMIRHQFNRASTSPLL